MKQTMKEWLAGIEKDAYAGHGAETADTLKLLALIEQESSDLRSFRDAWQNARDETSNAMARAEQAEANVTLENLGLARLRGAEAERDELGRRNAKLSAWWTVERHQREQAEAALAARDARIGSLQEQVQELREADYLNRKRAAAVPVAALWRIVDSNEMAKAYDLTAVCAWLATLPAVQP